MIIQQFTQTAFQQNTRVVACERDKVALCIDPGEPHPPLIDFLKANELKLKAIALTHGHLDHVGGTGWLKKEFPEADVVLHPDEEGLYYSLPQQPVFMGLQPHQLKELGMEYDDPPAIDRHWHHGEDYDVGSLRFNIRHCPGHTRGHVVLVESKHEAVFVGDCLFLGSIGRTDLPGGNHEQLLESINNNILSLGERFTVYSGHGPETTVGHERATNPFLTGMYSTGRGRYV